MELIKKYPPNLRRKKMINIIKLLAELFRLISNLINFMIIIIKKKKK